MRKLHIVGIAAMSALFAVGATMFFSAGSASASPAAQDAEESDRVDEKLREKGTSGETTFPALIWVYPVKSIELWEESLPAGAPGRPNKLRLEESRELMLATHFPYLKDGTDDRLTRVNFQREYHRQIDKGAKLVWTDGSEAVFSMDKVPLSWQARVGRDE